MLARLALRPCVIAAQLTLIASATHAADSTWLVPVDGSFADPLRWSAGVPGPSDAALFGPVVAPAPYLVTIGTPAILSGIVVANQRPTLTVLSPASLTVNGALTVGGERSDHGERFDATLLTLEGASFQAIGESLIGCDGASGVVRSIANPNVVSQLSIGCGGGVGEWQVQAASGTSAGLYLVGAGSVAQPSIQIGVGGDGALAVEDDPVSGAPATILSSSSSVWTVGADGGSGVLTMRGGTHSLEGTLRLGGDGPGPKSGGNGVWSAANVKIMGPGLSLTVGSEGFGALQLAGHTDIASLPIIIGADGGTGVIEAVGTADLAPITLARIGSSGTIVVGGSGSSLTTSSVTIDGGEGNIVILDGGFLTSKLELKSGEGSIQLEGDGSAIYLTRLERLESAGSGVLRCDLGENTVCTVELLRAPPTAAGDAACELHIANGATLDVMQFQTISAGQPTYLLEIAPGGTLTAEYWQSGENSTIRLSVADGDVSTVEVSACFLKGTLEVVDAGSAVPPSGTGIRLITGTSLKQSFSRIETPTWHGFPGIVVWNLTSVDLLVTDHVDALKIPSTLDVWVGLELPFSVSAVVDGQSFDVTQQVEWELDPGLAAIVDGTSIIGLAAGTTAATVRFGAIERQVTLVVRDDVDAIPFRLVDTVNGAWASTNGDLGGAGFADRGSLLSFDGSTAIFATRYQSLLPNGVPQVSAVVKDLDVEGVSVAGTLVESVEHAEYLSNFSLSRDGRYATFSSWDVIGESPAATAGSSKVYLLDRTTQTIEIISVDSLGGPVNGNCTRPEIAGDGRWVYFLADATDIVPGVDDNDLHVYRRDRWNGLNELVTTDAQGTPLTGVVGFEAVTPDGRFILFDRNGANGNMTVWRKDLVTGELLLISKDLQGSGATLYARTADLSADGRFVAYIAEAFTPMVKGVELNGNEQAYLFDVDADETSLLSRTAIGQPVEGLLRDVGIDDAGTTVALLGYGNFGVSGPSELQEAWRLNRLTGAIEEISRGVVGPFNRSVDSLDISGDGMSILLETMATNVLPFDTDETVDVFVWRAPSPVVVGDLDGDGTVGPADLAILLGAWGSSAGPSDLDIDGAVGASDLAILLGQWEGLPSGGG